MVLVFGKQQTLQKDPDTNKCCIRDQRKVIITRVLQKKVEINTFFIQRLKGVGQYAVKSAVFKRRIDLLRTYLFVGRGILTRY